MLRTRLEIAEELEALKELAASEDEGLNTDSIDVQINIIKVGLTSEQIRYMYDEDTELLEAGLTAHRWLREDGDSPSETWQEQLAAA